MPALLATPPAPRGTMGSRKAAPKVEKKPRQKRKAKPPEMPGKYAYEYEVARVMKEGKKAKKAKRR
jgi:hypothetical protein